MPSDYHLADLQFVGFTKRVHKAGSQSGGFGSEPGDFTSEDLVGGGALVEATGGSLKFQPFELRRQGVGSHVGAGSFAVVGEAHCSLRILIANCLVKQDHLAGGVVYQGSEDLAH